MIIGFVRGIFRVICSVLILVLLVASIIVGYQLGPMFFRNYGEIIGIILCLLISIVRDHRHSRWLEEAPLKGAKN